MRIIGITGGVGAGKSEILSFIRKNYPSEIYLADEVAHKIKEKGEPCYEQLVTLLGREILDEDGQINKLKMAAIIFEDEKILKKVNEIIHPCVKEYILARIRESKEKQEDSLPISKECLQLNHCCRMRNGMEQETLSLALER